MNNNNDRNLCCHKKPKSAMHVLEEGKKESIPSEPGLADIIKCCQATTGRQTSVDETWKL